MKIYAHTLVKNEERFVWFAVNSVINYVDKVLLWDTGSTDNTVTILKELKKLHGDKIDLKLLDSVTPSEFTQVRQEMLNNTKSDWIMILDGDEVWWNDSIKSVVKKINESGDRLDSIISPNFNIVGDIFHYQEEKAGGYNIDNYHGHINIRFFRNSPGIHFSKPHGQQGIYDNDDILIQNRDPKKRLFLKYPYMHFTNINRSLGSDNLVPKRSKKLKYDLGIPFKSDFYYPEVFFMYKPDIIPSPWIKRTQNFTLRALVETPLRKLKRRLLPQKVGY